MEYKNLPGTDIEVSTICLGSMNWGQQNTEPQAHEQLDYAISQGINFIDTAEIYPVPPEPEKQGLTEQYIGSWLKKSGKRDDLIIASKVCASTIITTRERSEGGSTKLDRKNIREAVEGSLSRLGIDYLDLYQVHWPEGKTNFFGVRGVDFVDETESTPIEETLEALDELVKEGKVRAIGVSNETPWGMNEYLRLSGEKSLTRVSTIQNQYSLLNRTFELELSEICLKEDIGLLVYSPLSFGVLTGKYLNGAKPDGARFSLWPRNTERYNSICVQPAIARYVELAKEHGLDPAQMAISFCLNKPFTTSVIIGATSVEQLKTDIEAVDLNLSNEVLEGINGIYTEIPDPHA